MLQDEQLDSYLDSMDELSHDSDVEEKGIHFSLKTDNELDNLKLILAKSIVAYIVKKRWNQKYAAAQLDIDQPKISQMKNNKIAGFSIERLFRFLVKLDWEIDIVLKKK